MTLENDTWSADNDETNQVSTGFQQPIDMITVYGVDEEGEGKKPERALSYRLMDQRRLRTAAIVAVCMLACGLLAVLIGQVLTSDNAGASTVVRETSTVTRKDFENVVSATGALKAGSTIAVTPEIDGIVESVNVREGQSVKEGEILIRLKNDELEKAVADAKRDIEAAEQGVTSAENTLEQAQDTRDEKWKRYNDAWSTADANHREWAAAKESYASRHAAWESAVAAAESIKPTEDMRPGPQTSDPEWEAKNQAYQEALAAYEEALANVGEEPQPAGAEPTYPEKPDDVALDAAVTNAEDKLTTANTTLAKAKETYENAVKKAEKREVKAPCSGIVVTVNTKVGEAASSGTSSEKDSGAAKSLVEISDSNSLTISADVSETDILSIKKGQWAKATFSAVPDVEDNAIISDISSTASGKNDDGVVTFKVDLLIPQPDSRLRAGMSANIKVVTVSVPGALVIPTQAVTEDSGVFTVEVVTDEESMETESRRVLLGERSATEVVVEGGLNEGETILLNAVDTYGK